jgi:hypothetical protein
MKKAAFLLIGLLLAGPFPLFAESQPGELGEGQAAYNNNDLNEAIRYLNIAVQKDPQCWKAYEILGYAYNQQARLALALAACDQSLKINPSNDPLVKFRDNLASRIGTTDVSEYTPPKPTVTANGTVLYPENVKTFYGDIAITNPYSPSDFQTAYSPYFSFGVGLGQGFSRIFSANLSADFNSFVPNQSSVPPGYSVTGGEITNVLILVNAKFRFIAEDNPVVPYGVVGLGAAFYNAEPVTIAETSYPFNNASSLGLTSSDFAFRLALGIDIKMQPGSYLFIESNGIGTSTGLENIVYNVLKLGFKYDYESNNPPNYK